MNRSAAAIALFLLAGLTSVDAVIASTSPNLRKSYRSLPDHLGDYLAPLCSPDIDDPYEGIFTPCLPQKDSSKSRRENSLLNLDPKAPVTSMITVEHGLSTSYIEIDGNRHPLFGYSLLRDLIETFKDHNWYAAGNHRPPCNTPSVRAKNLSAQDALSFLAALDIISTNPEESKQIVAIYLKNIKINAAAGENLEHILLHNNHLQNLWLEYCDISEDTLNGILKSVMDSHLHSFWLLDENTDFSLPPPILINPWI